MEFEDKIPTLITGYLRATLIKDEVKDLYNWLNKAETNKQFFVLVTDEKLLARELKNFNREDVTERLNNTLATICSESSRRPVITKNDAIAGYSW